MPPYAVPLDFRDFLCVAPSVVLAAWGLVVVMADLVRYRSLSSEDRRRGLCQLSLAGVGLAIAAATVLLAFDLLSVADPARLEGILGTSLTAYFSRPDGLIFAGTLARGFAADAVNLVILLTLALTVWLAGARAFTEEAGESYALLLWSAVGALLLAAAEEMVTLFVALETMTICLYLAAALEKGKLRSPEAGLKYFVYGSVSSALFLYGLSLVYGFVGSTYLDAIGRSLGDGPDGLAGNLAGASAMLLVLVGFGFKVAAVPFQQWAPDVYEGAPAPVAAWIASGSKVAGIIALMKVLLHAMGPWSHPEGSPVGPGWLGIVVVMAAASMTYGNFAALAQRSFKRMLAYSSIAHAGYMLVGVAAVGVSSRGPDSAGTVLYYLGVYAFANVGAFAVATWLERDRGDAIDDLAGLGRSSPILALAVTVLMLSLIGIPPFAGFFGKLYMFMEALRQGPSDARVVLTWLVALGLFNTVVSAFYYVRVLRAMYLAEVPAEPLKPAGRAIAGPIVVAALVVTVTGLMPEPFVDLARSAATPMLTARRPESLVESVVSEVDSTSTGPPVRPAGK